MPPSPTRWRRRHEPDSLAIGAGAVEVERLAID
jgi:hypothetical protein